MEAYDQILIASYCCTGYGERGERLVAGLVPLTADKRHVLLISSTSRKSWVLPKGGWELDEDTVEEAARREAWEEAGIVVKISCDLGQIDERRKEHQFTVEAPRAAYHFFEAIVEKLEDEWPEMDKRTRQWMDFAQATQALKGRPELLDALNRSNIIRS